MVERNYDDYDIIDMLEDDYNEDIEDEIEEEEEEQKDVSFNLQEFVDELLLFEDE